MSSARMGHPVPVGDRVRNALLTLIAPWFNREEEAAKQRRSEEIHKRSVRARIAAEQVRADYALAAERLRR